MFEDAGGTLLKRLINNLTSQNFFEIVTPLRCVGCELPGTILCSECEAQIEYIDQSSACRLCGAPFGRDVCTECKGDGLGANRVVSAAYYSYPIDTLIKEYKDNNERDASKIIARCMLEAFGAVRDADSDFTSIQAVTFIPNTSHAYKKRGFDHMEKVAHDTADILGLPILDILIKKNTQDLRALNRTERIRAVERSIRTTFRLDGLSVLLLDDVITTGSTIQESCSILKQSGVRDVFVLSAARVW